jgi:hypothetical protein
VSPIADEVGNDRNSCVEHSDIPNLAKWVATLEPTNRGPNEETKWHLNCTRKSR